MSVIFGRWNFEGRTPSTDYLDRLHTSLAAYAPDGCSSYSNEGVSIIYYPFHTTRESRCGTQPSVTKSGAIVAWDGRLDNRKELIDQSREPVPDDSPDASIVAAAYERWGTQCFEKFVGDWAISIWNPSDRSLILAKDFVGTRQLYYSLDKDNLIWSTVLDPLVPRAGKILAFDEEYLAGWLSFFPASHLTPYVGIQSVPPCSFVHFQNKRQTIIKYRDFDPTKRIRYKTDAEYEDHFRFAFAESVRRRLRSGAPILAELSGGMDSSSIVCMADAVIARGVTDSPRLDTLSYYDDSEPNWNEYPYFTKVEEKRGRIGCHIDVGSQRPFDFTACTDRFAPTPTSGGRPSQASRQFANSVTSQGYRVLLSGTGGDEVTGGIPTPMPELANLLVKARFRLLAHQLKVWALNKRRPWFYLLLEAARGFFPSAVVGLPKNERPAPWLNPVFVRNHRVALSGYRRRLRVFGAPPSFQENLFALEVLRRQLACSVLPSEPAYERRYPYLDRDLLEFLFAIPREQLVRPGQRRSLMRRALTGIVPPEILNRTRKAFVARGPTAAISAQWNDAVELTREMVSSSLGIVIAEGFADALENARRAREMPTVPLFRTIAMEAWLRSIVRERPVRAPVDGPMNVDARLIRRESTPVLK